MAPFGVFGFILAVCYFLYFAGIGGHTIGEQAMRVTPIPAPARDLRGIGVRALRCAMREASIVYVVGLDTSGLVRQRLEARRTADAGHQEPMHAITEL